MRLNRRIIGVLLELEYWLYKLGNEYTAVTGGWQARAWTGNGSIWNAKAPGLTKNGEHAGQICRRKIRCCRDY